MKRRATVGEALCRIAAAIAIAFFAGSYPAISQGQASAPRAVPEKRLLTFDYVGSTEGFAPIPFERYRNEIFFKAKINGIDATILLDNGTGTTEVDTGFAARAGLKSEGPARVVSTGTAQMSVRTVDNVRIEIPHLLTVSGMIVTSDLSRVAKIIGHPIDAILGGDVLNANAMALITSQKQLYLMPSGKIAPQANAMTIPLVNNGEISAEINGHPVRLFIDLGANGNVVLSNDSWSRAIPRDAPVTTSRFTNGEGVIMDRKRSTGNTIRVAGATITGIDITNETRDLRGLDGLLGNEFLSHFDVVLDAPAKKLILIPFQRPPGS